LRCQSMLRVTLYSVLTLIAWPAGAAERIFDFRDLKLNETPPGFRSTVAGSGQPGEWKIVLDEVPGLAAIVSTAPPPATQRPVLAQLSRDRTDEHSPILIWEEETFGDFKVSTRFKLVEGETEQMAGLAFRL